MTQLSWKPKATGEKFCAPACGRGCTQKEHDEAVANASALAQQLGDGWLPDVWENMGWHWAAVSRDRRWKVHPSGIAGYTVFVGRDATSGGTWLGEGSTPLEALADAKRCVRGELSLLLSLLNEVSDPHG